MTSQATERNAFTLTKTAHSDTYPAIAVTPETHAGKIVFITGASRGIGRSLAVSYAQAGAAGIVIAARTIKGLKETADAIKQASAGAVEVLQLELDVVDEKSTAAAAEAARARFGRLDILVNNAGYFEDPALIGDSDPKEWWKVWEVNILGTYLVTRALLPLLLAGGDKTVVNLSTGAVLMTAPTISAYFSSKFGQLKLTEELVVEYGEKGLLAYGIHPGAIPSDMSKKLPEAMQGIVVDTLELAAHSITWLTRERREWLNGRYVSSNWDVLELLEQKDEIVEKDLLKMKLAV